MKRTSPWVIVPLAVIALLLLAWFLRWDTAITESTDKLKIIHRTDRWTGQAWVFLYGERGKTFYSGEMHPIPTEYQIARRKDQLIDINAVKELEAIISEQEQKKTPYIDGHNSYVRTVESNVYKAKEKLDDFAALRFWIRYDKYAFGRVPDYEDGVPQEVISAHELYLEADREKRRAASEYEAIFHQAEENANKQVTEEAWYNLQLATRIWIGLLAVSSLWLVVAATITFEKNKKRQKAAMENPESTAL